MKHRKRILATVIILCMVLSGCGASAPSEKAAAYDMAASSAESAPMERAEETMLYPKKKLAPRL